MPLRAAILPGRSTSAVTVPSPGCESTTRSRGVPSPMTISERPTVTASARPGQAVGTAPSAPFSPDAKTTRSPRATSRSAAAPSRIFGPARSMASASGRPARPAAARRPAARAPHCSGPSWAQLMRPPSIPAATSASRLPGASVDGPGSRGSSCGGPPEEHGGTSRPGPRASAVTCPGEHTLHAPRPTRAPTDDREGRRPRRPWPARPRRCAWSRAGRGRRAWWRPSRAGWWPRAARAPPGPSRAWTTGTRAASGPSCARPTTCAGRPRAGCRGGRRRPRRWPRTAPARAEDAEGLLAGTAQAGLARRGARPPAARSGAASARSGCCTATSWRRTSCGGRRGRPWSTGSSGAWATRPRTSPTWPRSTACPSRRSPPCSPATARPEVAAAVGAWRALVALDAGGWYLREGMEAEARPLLERGTAGQLTDRSSAI